MGVHSYDELAEHVGHQIACVTYGGDANVSLECETCCEVLLDFDHAARPPQGEPEVLALYFTPDAIRAHFEGDEGPLADAIASASDEQLAEIGEYAVTADTLYVEFHRLLDAGATEILKVEER